PSEQLAAEAFTESPEITSVVARRVHAAPGRRLGSVVLLTLDGSEIFDEDALAAFEAAAVAGLAGTPADGVEIAGRSALQASGAAVTAVGFREGNLLVLVTSPAEADAVLVATRQIEAMGRG